MKKIILKFALMAIVAVSFAACSKYEEGSKFTLLSKQSRLVNNWEVQKITANGTDVTDLNLITEMNIKKDGTISTSSAFFNIPTTTEGTWVFDNDKTHVIVTNGADLENYEIIKLKKDELKVQATTDNVLYILEYVSM